MARVLLEEVNKIYHGSVPLKKEWYEVWKPGTKKAEVHVVKGVNLDIQDGEFLVLVGASGCGKSTTLRMVAGLEDITDGKIYIGETLVNDLSPKDRDIAMVFQNYALYPHMNVFENMAFGLRLRKMSETEIQKRVNDAAELLKLEPLLHRKPKELSGGQRQRVAMGRAIVRRPKVYLMDEPLSNLDAKLRVGMRAELQKLHRSLGVTTIYVTHDQTEAMTLGDRIVVMHNGIVQQNDTPLNIYERPANQYVAGFIGSPPMNLLKASIVKDGSEKISIKTAGFQVQAAASAQQALLPYVDKEVTMGVRAEDIQDKASARDPRPETTIKATVDVFEPLGSEVYLYLSLGGEDSLVARVDAHTRARVGETIELVLNMENVHVFDRDTELCVTSQAAAARVGA